LRQTRLTDTGLAALKGFPSLRMLDLSETRITDAAVPYLQLLHNPKWLGLEGTALSAAGIAQMGRTFPDLAILT
jgi:hypothetical protein